MSYDTDERSVQDGLPQELYVITTPTTTYRLTSAEEDIEWSSETYESDVISRGNVVPANATDNHELIVSLPVDHAVATSLLAAGIPEQNITFLISRIHPTASSARELWRGYVAGTSTDNQYLRLRVVHDVADALAIQLPIAKGSRTCQHQLYDAGCKVQRIFFAVPLNVDSVNGTTLMVTWTDVPPASGYTTGGDITTYTGSERRTIISQTSDTIVISSPFKSDVTGEDLIAYAGCDHTIEECRDKFGNVANFGGHPHLPDNQPTVPNGYGVIVQE